MGYKTFQDFEWSMGNGQCPCCGGNKPGMGWWTETVGHKRDCVLAEVMAAGMCLDVDWEVDNPEKVVGCYALENGAIASIRVNDPEKEAKLALGYKQDCMGVRSFEKAMVKLADAVDADMGLILE